jgi:hypothetical protein
MSHNVTWVTSKLCGVDAANIAQDRNARAHLWAEQINYL